jgi:opacity protein-like surface antigen
MSRLKAPIFVLSLIVLPIATAYADDAGGVYAVARAGGAFNPDVKFDTSGFTAFNDSVKYKVSPTGEVGAGYQFSSFRLEQTLGYTSSNAKDVESHAKAYTMTISALADIPVSQVIVPYLGGGMGAVRIDTQASLPDVGGEVDSKSWGPFWHLDAGIGFHLTRKVTVEFGGRYSKTFSMKGIGNSNGILEVSDLRGASVMLGARYLF